MTTLRAMVRAARQNAGLRPLLVGEANPYGAAPEFALWPDPPQSAGARLCRYVFGLDAETYLASFDRVNLCAMQWRAKEAWTRAAAIMDERNPGCRIILCGAKVARSFGLDAATAERPVVIVGRYVAIPHPSGLCRLWNPDTVAAVRARMAELLPWIPFGGPRS